MRTCSSVPINTKISINDDGAGYLASVENKLEF